MITARNLHRHELIGMMVEVIQSTDRQMLGIKGRVLDETKHLLFIASAHVSSKALEGSTISRKVAVPKKDCTFRFTLPSGELVDVAGSLLRSKSENRIKNLIRKRW